LTHSCVGNGNGNGFYRLYGRASKINELYSPTCMLPVGWDYDPLYPQSSLEVGLRCGAAALIAQLCANTICIALANTICIALAAD
jgi:hypothetical protein